MSAPESQALDLPDANAWASWLEAHQPDHTEAWLRIAKRRSGIATISISDALDVALCFGWIDGQRKALDEVSFLQRYCRRRPTSTWSQVNVGKVEALAAAGRMRPSGLAEVEVAKADGRWDAAYASQRTATTPPELELALAGNDAARAGFEGLGRSDRYVVILPLLKARSPDARAKAVAAAVSRLTSQHQAAELPWRDG